MTSDEFKEIIQRYQRPVICIIYKMIYDWEISRELAQDVFVSLWNSRKSVDTGRPLFTYLYRIAMNRTIDYSRKIKTVPLHFEPEEPVCKEGDFEKQELMHALKEFALKLPPQQRAIFVLRDLEGLSFEEISTILSLSVGAIRSSLHLARQTIKKHLLANHREVLYEYGLS